MGQSDPAYRLSFEAKQSAPALYLLLLFTAAAAVLRVIGLNAAAVVRRDCYPGQRHSPAHADAGHLVLLR